MTASLDGPPTRVQLPGDVELHLQQGGTGPALVFLHGVMGDWQSWAPQWAAFCARHRCTSYSRRYNHPNRNTMPSPAHSALVEAQDLLHLLDALDIGRAALVGSSYGGFVALALALQQPQRVAAVVAVEPAMLCYAGFSAAGRQALAQFRQAVVAPANAAFRRGDDALGARLMTGGIHGRAAPAADDAAMARRLHNARAMRMLALSQDEFPLLPPTALAALPMPVLLVRGQHTAPVHAEVFRNVCAAMPQARSACVPGAGHAVAREQPAAFNALALGFLQQALAPVAAAAPVHSPVPHPPTQGDSA